MSMKLTEKCTSMEYVWVENNIKNDRIWYELSTEVVAQSV